MMNWAEYEKEERKHERSHLRRIMAAVLIGGLVAVGAILWSKNAAADSSALIARDGSGNWIRLHGDPCAASVEWMKLRRAEMFYQGKKYGACWRLEQGTVLVFDDNGDLTPVPAEAFSRDVDA